MICARREAPTTVGVMPGGSAIRAPVEAVPRAVTGGALFSTSRQVPNDTCFLSGHGIKELPFGPNIADRLPVREGGAPADILCPICPQMRQRGARP